MISGRIKFFSPSSFSLGQYINHSKSKANVLQFDYEFTPKQLTDHKLAIPVFTFNAPINTETYQRGLVFVALRDLCDEEIFFDYRFRPAKDKPMPAWASY